MEIELTTVIAAILQVCANDRRSFTPSSVRSMIQRTNPLAARMESALISGKMQPHIKTLLSCECIERIPTIQLRNRPCTITNRDRLKELLADPSRVHEFHSERIGIELEPDDSPFAPIPADPGDPNGFGKALEGAKTELLEALDEHEADLQEVTSKGLGELMEKLRSIEQQLAFLHEHVDASSRRLDKKLAGIASIFAPDLIKRLESDSGGFDKLV